MILAPLAIYLTMRETEVVRLIASGASSKEAAILLSIAPGTIERHIENVRNKTGTRNRVHMIATILADGVLERTEAEKSDVH